MYAQYSYMYQYDDGQTSTDKMYLRIVHFV